jgi:hypothetical protein
LFDLVDEMRSRLVRSPATAGEPLVEIERIRREIAADGVEVVRANLSVLDAQQRGRLDTLVRGVILPAPEEESAAAHYLIQNADNSPEKPATTGSNVFAPLSPLVPPQAILPIYLTGGGSTALVDQISTRVCVNGPAF